MGLWLRTGMSWCLTYFHIGSIRSAGQPATGDAVGGCTVPVAEVDLGEVAVADHAPKLPLNFEHIMVQRGHLARLPAFDAAAGAPDTLGRAHQP